jgi:diguanylate cyclase (GGDEF)-like protein/PAS domain S-box-containing protein
MARPRARRFPSAFWKSSRTTVAGACIASIALIGGALSGTAKIESNVAGMYRYNSGPIDQLRQVRALELDLRRQAWKMLALHGREGSRANHVSMQADLLRIGTVWRKYRAIGPSTQWEKANTARLDAHVSRVQELLAQTFVLLERGQNDAVERLLSANLDMFDQLDALLDAGVTTNVAQSAQAVADSSRIFKQVFWTAVAVVAVVIWGAAALLSMIRQRNDASNDARFNGWLCDQLVDATLEGVVITDAEATILRVNAAFTRITGYTEAEVLGRKPTLLSSGRQSEAFYREMWTSLRENGKWKGDVWNRTKEGSLYLESLSIAGIPDRDGNFNHYACIFTDITHHKETEIRLNYLAMHDALTGLANRNLFNSQLDHAIARAKRNARVAAVMFIDLDGFKEVNDTFGHAAGDDLLIGIAERLKGAVREADLVARLGGDEFVILLEDITTARAVARLAETLRDSVGQPVVLGTHEAFVTPSIGISIYPDDARNAAQLLERADQAMYEAKRAGKNAIRFASAVAAPAAA